VLAPCSLRCLPCRVDAPAREPELVPVATSRSIPGSQRSAGLQTPVRGVGCPVHP